MVRAWALGAARAWRGEGLGGEGLGRRELGAARAWAARAGSQLQPEKIISNESYETTIGAAYM